MTETFTCIECGNVFELKDEERAFYVERGLKLPKRCKTCRRNRKIIKQKEDEKLLALEKGRERVKEEKQINNKLELLTYKQERLCDLTNKNPQNTLFIIGNGFDLMHGAKSSYRDFQSTIGKDNSLRYHLEHFIKCDDLWGDFEENLGKLDVGAMLGVIDSWLDINGAYGKSSNMADYYGAIDDAMLPIQVITHELPRRFGWWVRGLTIDKDVKPFAHIIRTQSRYLNFNYTSFLESNYGVPKDNIFYIHGCAKRKKEKLILGHSPNIDYLKDFKPSEGHFPNYKSDRKRELLYNAVNIAIERWVHYYDEMTTKKAADIIADNREYFRSLSGLEYIYTLGHSLSKVDHPYLMEIHRIAKNAEWCFGWHGLEDLQRICDFVSKAGIESNKVKIFRN